MANRVLHDPHKQKRIVRLMLAFWLATLALTTPAAITVQPWAPMFRGIDFAGGDADTNEVRLQKVFALRVDLTDPTIEFFSTPSNGDAPLETLGQTTTTFVQTYGVAVGVNANFFSPVNTTPNDPRDILGLAISQGNIVSSFESDRPAMLVTRSNQVIFTTSAPGSYSNIWTAVSGSDLVLINGQPQLGGCTTPFCGPNPRTALGLSQDNHYLYLVVIDGRQPGWSDGATLEETGQWLHRLGYWNGLNLDGGGSSAMSRLQGGSAVLLNRPSGGVQRVNGNHIGVFAVPPGGAPVILAQPQSQTVLAGQSVTFSVSVSGTAPLSYTWRFNSNNLPGASAATYTLTNAQSPLAGTYSVLVTNSFGSTLSSNAALVVTPLLGLGDNTFAQVSSPANPSNLVAVAAGGWHSLALCADGVPIAWGDNSSGQCDLPPALTNAVAIAAGEYHSLAIRADGTVMTWGANDFLQCAVPVGVSRVIAVAAGTWHSLALRTDGSVVAWGDNAFGQTAIPACLSEVAAVAAGGNHSLALKAKGSVVAWGENTSAEGYFTGQSTVPVGLSNVVAIAAGEYHSLALKSDGTVVAWGDNSQGQCDVPANLTNVVAIVSGGAHNLALRSDGTVVAWGANWSGQCALPPGISGVVGVAAGAEHSLLLAAGAMPSAQLLNPEGRQGQFSTVIQTMNRRTYVLEFKASAVGTNWTALSPVLGNGSLRLLVDPNAVTPQRFYRVRQDPL
jgi:exopolysaccharide biosynthesis protein